MNTNHIGLLEAQCQEKISSNINFILTLYGVWGINIFNNIKNVELTHINAVM